MKFVTWNVNGLRAALTKGFADFFAKTDADIFAIQESKLQPEQLEFFPEGYETIVNSAKRKGYSGTIVFTKKKPLSTVFGINGKHDDEGRVITLEYDNFYFITSYTPNSQTELKRLDYRMEFEDDMREYLKELSDKKPVVFCGDLNVAHKEIDLENPASNHMNPGFSDEEREKMSLLLESGFTDCYRYLYPERTKAYSWWSYRFSARAKNIGWRIDYFIVSNTISSEIKECSILSDVLGSDHCPVELEIF